jgi:hypothetical protein
VKLNGQGGGLPPADRVDHPEIKAAIIACNRAIDAERTTRQDHVQAELELPASEFKDEQALADAQAAGKKDPGPVHADKHRALIRDLKRRHGAAKITRNRAQAAVTAAFEEHGDEWEARLNEQHDALREQISHTLDEFQALHQQLVANNANREVGTPATERVPEQRVESFGVAPNTHVLPVAEVVARLRALGEPKQPKTTGHTEVGGKLQWNGVAVDRKQRIKEWNDADDAAAREQAAALAAEYGDSREARIIEAEMRDKTITPDERIRRADARKKLAEEQRARDLAVKLNIP